MKRLALGIAMLLAVTTSTATLAHARPDPLPNFTILAADDIPCAVDDARGGSDAGPDAAGWCPRLYNGLSDWLAARNLGVAVSGDGSAVVASLAPDEGESGTLATEPQSAGGLPGASEPAPPPMEAGPVEPPETPAPVALPTATAAPAPSPTAVPTVALPRGPIPLSLTSTNPSVLYSYYDVAGLTYGDVQDQATKNGPADGHGEHWAGATNWSMSWKAKAVPDGRLTEVQVTYAAKVTLPRWTPPVEASDADVQQWSEYVDQLARHENGHVDILLTSIPRVLEALKSANKSNAQTVFDAEFKGISQRQDDYDATTNHGLN